MPTNTCYMCDAVKTSMEHAPPDCMFPKFDLVNEDLRLNLVTVPACDLHNSKKSKDDEFFRAIMIFASAKNSEVAKLLFHDKLMRAVQRNPHTYNSFIKPIGLKIADDQILKVDSERLERCATQIARAIYFHTYKTKWLLPILFVSPNLHSVENSIPIVPGPFSDAIKITKEFLASEPIRGENPKVFKYRTRFDSEAKMYGFGAIFYDTFEVFCASSPAMSQAVV